MKRFTIFIILMSYLCALCMPVFANDEILIEDNAGLFSEDQKALLKEHWSGIQEIPDAAIVTSNSPGGSTSSFAENYAISHYGNSPAVIFVIDMRNREIYIYSNGSALNALSKADARAITDNIYKLASKGDYYSCADKAFTQIAARFRGEAIARPVKHITNAMIALLLSIIINYCIVVFSRSSKKQKTAVDSEGRVLRASVLPGVFVSDPVLIKSERHYHSSGSSGGGGGGGGGGHSGGGGGHSF